MTRWRQKWSQEKNTVGIQYCIQYCIQTQIQKFNFKIFKISYLKSQGKSVGYPIQYWNWKKCMPPWLQVEQNLATLPLSAPFSHPNLYLDILVISCTAVNAVGNADAVDLVLLAEIHSPPVRNTVVESMWARLQTAADSEYKPTY